MDPIRRHSAGATVTHRGPFSTLEVPAVESDPPKELIDRWVVPLYMSFFEPAAKPTIASLLPFMTDDIARQLLSYFNWRPRIVGAYVAALKGFSDLTQQIGRLLLRSDVCYAGGGYCLALASINTLDARQYLEEYLDYYLKQKDLWFDQADAMGAVAYLDGINRTTALDRHIPAWSAFTKNKPNWDLSRSCGHFSKQMELLAALRRS